MEKKAITEKLDAAGIEYDVRLGAEKLAELLPVEAPKADSVACVVLRDFWDEDGERHRKGKVIDMQAMDAIDMIEAGRVKRVR